MRLLSPIYFEPVAAGQSVQQGDLGSRQPRASMQPSGEAGVWRREGQVLLDLQWATRRVGQQRSCCQITLPQHGTIGRRRRTSAIVEAFPSCQQLEKSKQLSLCVTSSLSLFEAGSQAVEDGHGAVLQTVTGRLLSSMPGMDVLLMVSITAHAGKLPACSTCASAAAAWSKHMSRSEASARRADASARDPVLCRVWVHAPRDSSMAQVAVRLRGSSCSYLKPAAAPALSIQEQAKEQLRRGHTCHVEDAASA